MGVRGLKTFIETQCGDCLVKEDLHNCVLLIDGWNLLYYLYNTCKGSNPAFGGEYDKFEKTVKEFFDILSACAITPFVLIDGSYDESGWKFDTQMKRLKEKMHNALQLTPTTQGKARLLPLLAEMVFVSVLKELSVPFSQTEFEADETLAALALRVDGYVLSNDSDFFVFGVKCVPLSMLEMDIKTRTRLVPVPLSFAQNKYLLHKKIYITVLVWCCVSWFNFGRPIYYCLK